MICIMFGLQPIMSLSVSTTITASDSNNFLPDVIQRSLKGFVFILFYFILFYFINTSEIPGELSCKNMIQ